MEFSIDKYVKLVMNKRTERIELNKQKGVSSLNENGERLQICKYSGNRYQVEGKKGERSIRIFQKNNKIRETKQKG